LSGDAGLDIFAGSNTTSRAADKLTRNWAAFEKNRTCLAASAFRSVDELPAEELATLWSQLRSDALPATVKRQQKELVLMEKPAAYAEPLRADVFPHTASAASPLTPTPSPSEVRMSAPG